MQSRMICMAAGIVLVAFLPTLPPWYLCPVLVLPWLLAWRRRAHPLYALSLAFLLGVLWGLDHGYGVRRALLPTALELQPLLVRGRIHDLVQTTSSFHRPSLRFQLRVESCRRLSGGDCGADLRLLQLTAYEPAYTPRSGERWQFQVTLRRPRGLANPGGFDYEAYLVAHGISATGTALRDGALRLESASVLSIDHWRERLRDHLDDRLRAAAHRDLLLALLLGDGAAISREQWRTFRNTGTVHLFVVSGLHIALSGGAVLWLGRLWWRGPWGASRRLSYVLGCVPAFIAALAYALLAGFNLPIQRALVMFTILLWTQASWRENAARDGLITAFWLLLLGDPLAARDAGFWFSFIVVTAMLLTLCGHRAAAPARWRWWRTQWAIFAASLPVLLVLCGQFTALALPANALAIPWSTLLTMPLAFAALACDGPLPALAAPLWRAADWSLVGLSRYLQWLEHGGASAIWQPSRLDTPTLLCAAVFAVLMLLPRATPGRLLAPLLLVPLLWPRLDAPAPGALRVTVIDVGQGLSVLVETARHALLYDTGPVFGSGATVAELAILPLLQRRGVTRLDLLVVSHRDSDHAGGWRTVVDAVPVRGLLVGDALGAPGEAPCRAGQRWRWDGVEFEMLHPQAQRTVGNNNSCVLRIGNGAGSVLLSGDIERAAEHRLLARGGLRPTTVLLAPHHGSRTSSGADFIERLRPHYVVFSTGHRNRFHHPNAGVVARYQTAGARLFDTADSGALVFALDEHGVAQITEQRRRDRHYWQD